MNEFRSNPRERGSLAWARRDQGRLRRSERLLETLQALRALARRSAESLGHRFGLRRRAFELALGEIPLPTTALARLAESTLATAPRWLLAHSLRTYLWGSLLARRDGLAPDAELFFVAALYHDLGLLDRAGPACFALRGAEEARRLLTAGGASPAFGERVADAITLHLNVRPSDSTVEAHLLRAGSGFDVVGYRFDDLARAVRQEVVTAWPRDGFAREVTAVLEAEATAHPTTRIGFLCHHLRFAQLIRDADARFERDRRAREGDGHLG